MTKLAGLGHDAKQSNRKSASLAAVVPRIVPGIHAATERVGFGTPTLRVSQRVVFHSVAPLVGNDGVYADGDIRDKPSHDGRGWLFSTAGHSVGANGALASLRRLRTFLLEITPQAFS